MIINLKIKNFRSYKEEVNLSFVSNSKIRKDKDHETNVCGLNIVKNCAILGSNASGKSNLIKAISFLKNIIIGAPITDNFAFKGHEGEPTIFDIVFSVNNKIFNYYFEIIKNRHLFGDYKIVSEYLYEINKKDKEMIYSSKDSKVLIGNDTIEDMNLKTYISGYAQSSNYLFLSYINMQDKIIENKELKDILFKVYSFFKNDLVVLSSTGNNFSLLNSNSIKNISKYLKKYDTGIEEIKFQDCSAEEVNQNVPFEILKQFLFDAKRLGNKMFSLFNEKELMQFIIKEDGINVQKLVSKHNNIEGLFNFESESEGTIRMMFLISILFTNDVSEKIFFIDEIERSMHPLMCVQLIKEFQKINYKLNKQLIFTTHYTDLIDNCVRRDEIYFIDKDNYGVSSIISLLEYKSRTDTSISKNYLEGRYGGVPKLEVEL